MLLSMQARRVSPSRCLSGSFKAFNFVVRPASAMTLTRMVRSVRQVSEQIWKGQQSLIEFEETMTKDHVRDVGVEFVSATADVRIVLDRFSV